ncbi:MAG: DUF2249 domain-containing protein [Deltaproteobacteria bacterium]|nr:DUF2249 domain-containing protein [Deltaproteobacteria bacterium]
MSVSIKATDRVAAVLARDERLLEVLVSASPAFEKLRNGALRRTFANLVTVEQAARIARVDACGLLERLNRALTEGAVGGATDEAMPRAPAPELPPLPAALARTPAARIVDLDVREDLRAGREPFQRIVDAAKALPADGVLRVRAIFEPAPLYGVFAKRGFAHATERLGDEDWRVWFHRDAQRRIATGGAPAPEPKSGDDVVFLDVRDLEPPEPMVRTLEALASLPRGGTLVQLNVRVPQLLLPKLAERGFTWEVREQSPDLVRLFIRHKTA